MMVHTTLGSGIFLFLVKSREGSFAHDAASDVTSSTAETSLSTAIASTRPSGLVQVSSHRPMSVLLTRKSGRRLVRRALFSPLRGAPEFWTFCVGMSVNGTTGTVGGVSRQILGDFCDFTYLNMLN
jgi:hypothetical protein